MIYYIILYHTIPYYNILYYAMLCYAMLCYTIHNANTNNYVCMYTYMYMYIYIYIYIFVLGCLHTRDPTVLPLGLPPPRRPRHGARGSGRGPPGVYYVMYYITY